MSEFEITSFIGRETCNYRNSDKNFLPWFGGDCLDLVLTNKLNQKNGSNSILGI